MPGTEGLRTRAPGAARPNPPIPTPKDSVAELMACIMCVNGFLGWVMWMVDPRVLARCRLDAAAPSTHGSPGRDGPGGSSQHTGILDKSIDMCYTPRVCAMGRAK